MPYLLNLVYLALVVLAGPWLAWRAARTGRYRRGWREKLWGAVPPVPTDRPVVWLHAVSVGELNVLAPLIAELEARRPGWRCVVSTTTAAGYELARQKFARHLVFWCPLDFSWAVRRALARVRPRLLVLCELELWPNLIRAAHETGAPVAVINGRLSEHSLRGYRRLGPWGRRLFASLDLVAAQSAGHAARFRAAGVASERLVTTGSIKFDGAWGGRDEEQSRHLAELAGFGATDRVWLAGSTEAPEEELTLEVFRQLAPRHPELRLVLVPRQPHRFEEVAGLLDRSGVAWQRRTALSGQPADPRARVLLVDTIGELAAWWGTAEIGFVGGSLGQRGGQNMIEPAARGVAVSFGPRTRNFRDAVELLLRDEAAVVVQDRRELAAFVERCLQDPDFVRALSERARRVVADQVGATSRTVDELLRLVEGQLARSLPRAA